MKLKDMDTMQMAACLCRIAPAVERIGVNERVHELLRGYGEKKDEHVPVLARYSRLVGTLAPALLGECIEETVEIVSAMTGKSVEEVKAQKGMQTIKDVLEFADADFIGFFGQSAVSAQEK